MSDFQLSPNDKSSSLWLRLRDHFAERLVTARQRNDEPSLSDRDTLALRGEIRVLKALLRLDAEPEVFPGLNE